LKVMMAERGVRVFLALATTFFILKDVAAAVVLHNNWKSDSKDSTLNKFSSFIFSGKED